MVCAIRRHLARAAEIAEKNGRVSFNRRRLQRSSLCCCNPAALAWLFRIGALVYDTQDIGENDTMDKRILSTPFFFLTFSLS